jgi:hypothetical protein
MQISKYSLCDACRKIRPTLNSKAKGDPIEEMLEYKGYGSPLGAASLNVIILTYLRQNNGCFVCIDLFTQATNE